MANKKIIDIDINDSQFNAFVKKFNAFQEALKETPEAWSAFNKAMKDAEKEAAQAEKQEQKAALQAKKEQQKEAARQAKAAQDSLRDGEKESLRLAREKEKSWREMSKSAGTFAKNVASSTVSILKWAAISGGLGLLGAGGGLFGISSLASSVGGSRRSAQGQGISTAQQKAFGLNFGRYVDAEGNLSRINEAKSDWEKRWAFGAMGIGQPDVERKNAAQLGVEMAIRAKEIFDRGDQSQQYAKSNGLLEFYTMDELRRLHATSMQDLRESGEGYGRDVSRLNLQDDTQKTWQDFSIQLSRAGEQIQNVFVKGLTPLIPQLNKLSDSFAKALSDILQNPKLTKWVDNLGGGIERFSKYLLSDEFQQSADRFVTAIGALADATVGILEFFNVLPSSKKPSAKSSGSMPEPTQDEAKKAGFAPRWWNFNGAFDSDYQKWKKGREGGGAPIASGEQQKYLADLEKKYRLPSGIMDNIWLAESSRGNPKKMLSSAGAQGHFGFMPNTQVEYGLKDPNDFNESADAAARKMRNLLRYFNGDKEKAAAGYSWGEGNVSRQIRTYGDEWKQHLPSETSNYIPQVTRNTGPVVVEIRNNTGGSAIVTTNQLAY